eukprot:14675684-Ditylum_brightwellii.AAC.1
MTMATATSTNNISRHIIFAMDTLIAANLPPTKRQLPKALAEASIKCHTSLLHTQIALALDHLSLEHLKLQAKAYHKYKQIQRITNDNKLIPKSIWVEFTFHVFKAAEETNEFKAFQECTQAVISTVCKTLKGKILDVMKLEFSLLEKETKRHFVRTLCTVAEVILLFNNITHNTDNVVATLIKDHHGAILKHLHLIITEFYNSYKAAHYLAIFCPILLDPLCAACQRTHKRMQSEA